MTSIDWFIVVRRGLTEMISDRSLPIFFSVMADYPLIPIFPGFFFCVNKAKPSDECVVVDLFDYSCKK